MLSLSVVVCSLLALAAATDVQQCPGQSIENLKEIIQLSPCKRLPCRLKKGTDQHITIAFTPKTDIDDLKNQVSAILFGVPFPFIGVDGNSVCNKLKTEDGQEAKCPLKAGTKYIYEDSFPVHKFYPSVEATVHWALNHNEKDIICFEVPVKIA